MQEHNWREMLHIRVCVCARARVCAFKLALIFIIVTFLISLQLVSGPIKKWKCGVRWLGAWIWTSLHAFADLQSAFFTADTWAACDISPGGSIYVQNKQEPLWIPALGDSCRMAWEETKKGCRIFESFITEKYIWIPRIKMLWWDVGGEKKWRWWYR